MFVSDSSKIGRTALMRFGNIAACQGLITDAGIQRRHLEALQKARVRVIVCDGSDRLGGQSGNLNPAQS